MHRRLTRLLRTELRPIHYKEAFPRIVAWMPSKDAYSAKTDPMEKFRQRYAEHPRSDVLFINGGYMACSHWFPLREQLTLLPPDEKVIIKGNSIVAFDAGYETAKREPYTLNKFGKDHRSWYERRRKGMLVESHVAEYFRKTYTRFFQEPSNAGNYEKPAKEDFVLVTPWARMMIDVKSVGDGDFSDSFVITNPNEVGVYIVADFCEDTNEVTIHGMITGDIVKTLGEKGPRHDMHILQSNNLWSIEPLLVALNMAECDMNYSSYKMNIKARRQAA